MNGINSNPLAAEDVKPVADRVPLDGAGVAHPQPFVCELTVGRHHLSGTIEHASNVQYVCWLDRLAELHSDAVGYTRQSLLTQGVMWFVARHEIDYRAEAWLGDRLLLVTWVRQFSRVKAWRDSVIWRPADQTVICRAATLWVLVDLKSRRPTRIPEQMAGRFGPLLTRESAGLLLTPPCTSP